MSDRIDTMAAALIAALGKYGSVHDAGYDFTTLTLYHDDMPRITRRLLAAMDAEPTEAEAEAASEAFAFEWPIHTYTESLGDREAGEAWHPSFEGAIYAALMAARGARSEAV